MEATRQAAGYRAYLLRCWWERPSGPGRAPGWRFSLEDPHTGARRGFTSLTALVTALRADLAGGGPPAPLSVPEQPADTR